MHSTLLTSRMETLYGMARRKLILGRSLCSAPFCSQRAPLTEGASNRQIRRVRHQAIDRHESPLLRIQLRQGAEQSYRIWMCCPVKNVLNRTIFNDLASIRYRNRFAYLCNNAEIMRDQDN